MTTHPHIHLIGIGGAGMSAIARVLIERGYDVSGSDRQVNELTIELEAAGVVVFSGHRAEQIGQADVVVRSSAVPDSNPEVVAARERGIPVLKRAEFLGDLMADRIGIAVAGTHGKTTTTGMIAQALLDAQLDPTIIVGGALPGLGRNGRAGKGPHFVIEADEYDRMFLGLKPRTAVVTNVEFDHPDIYPTPASYDAAYHQFVALLPADGHLIVCGDDTGARGLLDQRPAALKTTVYGIDLPERPSSVGIDVLQAKNITINEFGGQTADVTLNSSLLGRVSLLVPGRHNLLNALAAAAVLIAEEVPFETIRASLDRFSGMDRRFETRGVVGGITIIDDYAHHPTEIEATLKAGRDRFPGQRLWAVWQPHTFSRTKLFQTAFETCFEAADRVVVLDIYRSREADNLGITGETVAAGVKHPQVEYLPDLQTATRTLAQKLMPGDIIIIMNAGDATAMSRWLLDQLSEKLGKDGKSEKIIPTRSVS